MSWILCLVQDNICDFCSFCRNQLSQILDYVGVNSFMNVCCCYNCKKFLWNCICDTRVINPSHNTFSKSKSSDDDVSHNTLNELSDVEKKDVMGESKIQIINDVLDESKNPILLHEPVSEPVSESVSEPVSEHKSEPVSVHKSAPTSEPTNEPIIINKFTKEKCDTIINNLNMIINVKPYEKFWITGDKIMLNNSYWITRLAYGQKRTYIINFIKSDLTKAIELSNSLDKLDSVDNDLINIKEMIKKCKLGLENMKTTYPELSKNLDEIIEIIDKN